MIIRCWAERNHRRYNYFAGIILAILGSLALLAGCAKEPRPTQDIAQLLSEPQRWQSYSPEARFA
ncbi:MAG: hypothetical protein AAF975_01885, partial [Spirochaetota bacterium]